MRPSAASLVLLVVFCMVKKDIFAKEEAGGDIALFKADPETKPELDNTPKTSLFNFWGMEGGEYEDDYEEYAEENYGLDSLSEELVPTTEAPVILAAPRNITADKDEEKVVDEVDQEINEEFYSSVDAKRVVKRQWRCSHFHYFQCTTGQCIERKLRCDGFPHCPDRSDEEACSGGDDGDGEGDACDPVVYFTCSNGECIDRRGLCDNYHDCVDGSDEVNCPPCDERAHFQCKSGICIDKWQRCDGIVHCPDHSDEEECHGGGGSGQTGCARGQFRCRDGQCLNIRQMCDGRRDCRDGSDEASCSSSTCLPGQSRCSDGSACLEIQQWCDGRRDCRDSSDENSCASPTAERCRLSQFRCTNGQCLDRRQMCDGRSDCRDGSDEATCAVITFPDIVNIAPTSKSCASDIIMSTSCLCIVYYIVALKSLTGIMLWSERFV